MNKIKRWWRKFIDRHSDGTKHEWHNIRFEFGETHWCSWDYCHCQKQECVVCGETRVLSSGTMEIR